MDALARKLGTKPDRVAAWEAGEARPTFRQAQDLAHALHVPFGYLFLAEPPEEELPIPDRRTLPEARFGGVTAGFRVRIPEQVGHLFRNEVGRWFRFEVGRSDLKSATPGVVALDRWT
ncbi:MAG: helix-turn-helix domain-containing protein [Betaproteobacteria bacterium]